MNGCTVYFESELSPTEKNRLVEAIRQFRGIRFVEVDELSADAEEAVPHHAPAVPSGEKEAFRPSYVPPPPSSSFSTVRQPGMADPGGKRLDTQRHAINHAIKWAVRESFISVEELSKLSPEETVKRAMNFIDMMPEKEKKILGNDLSGLMG